VAERREGYLKSLVPGFRADEVSGVGGTEGVTAKKPEEREIAGVENGEYFKYTPPPYPQPVGRMPWWWRHPEEVKCERELARKEEEEARRREEEMVKKEMATGAETGTETGTEGETESGSEATSEMDSGSFDSDELDITGDNKIGVEMANQHYG
jgi:hypothetical protein